MAPYIFVNWHSLNSVLNNGPFVRKMILWYWSELTYVLYIESKLYPKISTILEMIGLMVYKGMRFRFDFRPTNSKACKCRFEPNLNRITLYNYLPASSIPPKIGKVIGKPCINFMQCQLHLWRLTNCLNFVSTIKIQCQEENLHFTVVTILLEESHKGS